ncbi:MAG: ADP-forming succinate--CoA ligase subunit beta [Proteobacteria bacterium]|nr:ADP-forming succinate--CoA ligase subunit beta [Pseudomonadota bacterium]
MKIHEYQAKNILKEFGIPVPRGEVVTAPADAKRVTQELGGMAVIKAQIHAGGRGKGGGIKLAHTPDEAEEIARHMLGMTLVTPQTGPEGRVVKALLVEEGQDIVQEMYLGIVVDRALGAPVIMASSAGGMEIEEVAAQSPEKIIKVAVDPATGFMAFHARKIAYGLGLEKELFKMASQCVANLYKAFVGKDCSLVEINPLIINFKDEVIALDAKINFDDDALFRHPELKDLNDPNEMDPLELEAKKFGLNYIKLNGNVGCMVNGAGLAMATMDLIKLAGGEPANFLDVGGGASAEQVENAFRILLSDPNVRVVLVNIFGGILRCDRVANGIVEAAKRINMKVPMVIRLEGTNVEEGRQILTQSGLKFEVAVGLKETAEKVAKLAR